MGRGLVLAAVAAWVGWLIFGLTSLHAGSGRSLRGWQWKSVGDSACMILARALRALEKFLLCTEILDEKLLQLYKWLIEPRSLLEVSVQIRQITSEVSVSVQMYGCIAHPLRLVLLCADQKKSLSGAIWCSVFASGRIIPKVQYRSAEAGEKSAAYFSRAKKSVARPGGSGIILLRLSTVLLFLGVRTAYGLLDEGLMSSYDDLGVQTQNGHCRVCQGGVYN